MLFRTVYGPELEAIYEFIHDTNNRVNRKIIHQYFSSYKMDKKHFSTQNIDDALSFLVSANLITEKKGHFITNESDEISFKLLCIKKLQQLTRHKTKIHHLYDPYYFYIFEELFVKLDKFFILDLHKEVNQLKSVTEIGGLSKEKIQSWKRVMEFLGIGLRVSTGFQFVYSIDLITEIINRWGKVEGTLQSFFDDHFSSYLPCCSNRGQLPKSLEKGLLFLEMTNSLQLFSKHDTPSKIYFDERKYNYIYIHGGRS
jgi:hypothetical protein